MEEKVKDALVWIDCEMTGLDIEKDALIEVSVIVTDAQLNPLDTGIDVLISPDPHSLENMDSFVRNMHTKSGLLEELKKCDTDMASATKQVLEYIRQYVEPQKALLAGNSVGTDKMFLARDMPEVIDFLHYRIVDVSSIKELAKRWFPKAFFNSPQKLGGHRALGDIQDSIAELRYYRRALFPEGEGPSSLEFKEYASETFAWRTSLGE
ncbi:oligoribonuclease [Actinomycetaceae bacterium TAE3-ERU4]|nr:oligoribonuclease [Actinomycetaceae bacterium TAE3-ERU4]